jgi:sulfate/thiosulfate-binding protein
MSTTEGTASPVANQIKDVEVTLVSCAVPKAAHDAILPKFAAHWQKEKGQTVTFKQSYGGSGSQTRAVMDGLEADIMHLALAADTEKLVNAGLVRSDWQTKAPNNGTVAKTVAAIIVRPGNPKNIKTFEDLARADVKWVTADPKTSGGARWNFMALWNDALKKHGNDEAKAKEFVTRCSDRDGTRYRGSGLDVGRVSLANVSIRAIAASAACYSHGRCVGIFACCGRIWVNGNHFLEYPVQRFDCSDSDLSASRTV